MYNQSLADKVFERYPEAVSARWYEDTFTNEIIYEFKFKNKDIKVIIQPLDLMLGLDTEKIFKSIEAQINGV